MHIHVRQSTLLALYHWAANHFMQRSRYPHSTLLKDLSATILRIMVGRMLKLSSRTWSSQSLRGEAGGCSSADPVHTREWTQIKREETGQDRRALIT
jgi:hypothetical protein